MAASSVISNQQTTRSEKISLALKEIGSLQNQENAEDARALQNDDRRCSEKICEIITSRIDQRKCLVPVVKLKPSLRRAQREGLNILKELMFPLFNVKVRELVTYVDLMLATLIVFTDVVLSAVDHTIADHQYVLFATCIGGLVFLTDFIIVIAIHKCKLVRDACKLVRDACKHYNNWCTKTPKESVKTESTESLIAPSSTPSSKCTRFYKHINRYADLVRLVLLGVCLYPLTISSMLTGLPRVCQNDTLHIDLPTGINITNLVVIVVWNAFFYVLCFAVITQTIHAIDKYRKDCPAAKMPQIQYGLFACVMLPMTSQVLMIVCIGTKICYENKESYSADGMVRISRFLWYMIIGGFLIPFIGFFTNILFSYYYIQEYLIGFFIDLVYNEVIYTEDDEVLEISRKDANIVADKLLKDMTNVNPAYIKVVYVLGSPFLVILSIVYAVILFGFFICCVLGPDPMTGETIFILFSDSTPTWVSSLMIILMLLIYLINFPVLLVVKIWMVITVFIILRFILSFLLSIPYVIVAYVVYKCSGKQQSQTTPTEPS